ncbi:hypothetical protein IFM89_039638, partial [Coptis chinensis]
LPYYPDGLIAFLASSLRSLYNILRYSYLNILGINHTFSSMNPGVNSISSHFRHIQISIPLLTIRFDNLRALSFS